MNRLRVDVWSDVACPWCYVGKRKLAAAIAELPDAAEVDVTWHAFELDPNAPRTQEPRQVSWATRLARKYGKPLREAEIMIERMVEVGKAEGIDFRFDLMKPGNTLDAHRLNHLARLRGRQEEMNERLMRAHFTEGESMSDPDALARIAIGAGLDAAEVDTVLSSDLYAKQVREDEAEAAEIGIRGVPFFVFGEKYAVSGAQPKESLLAVLERTSAELDAADAGGDAFDADHGRRQGV